MARTGPATPLARERWIRLNWRRALAVVLPFVLSAVHAQNPPSGSVRARDPAVLQGVWMLEDGAAEFGRGVEALLTPWGAERYAGHRPTIGTSAALDANDPTLACLPPGLPYILMIPTPFELIATGRELLQIFEYDHSLRRIHLDGRDAPGGLLADGMFQWMGYATGRWERNVLVIETRGFNEAGWLDRFGHPRSAELVVTERLQRLNDVTLVAEVTIEDPKTYVRPWSGRLTYRLRSNWEILEHVCLTERDVSAEYLEYKKRAWQVEH
jgi:hypothetical protein